jgi:hypothetical protein
VGVAWRGAQFFSVKTVFFEKSVTQLAPEFAFYKTATEYFLIAYGLKI